MSSTGCLSFRLSAGPVMSPGAVARCQLLPLEVEISETPDLATATSSILVEGATLSWTLLADGYTLRSTTEVAVGLHTLEIGVGLLDLQGQPLPQPETMPLEIAEEGSSRIVFASVSTEITASSTVGNAFGFQGHRKDAETGFLYVRNRYYDPEIGRFITADPMGYVDGPSMYQFGGYSPVNFTDPLGLETKAEWQALLKKEMLEKYGVDLDDWDPSKGFEHNKEIVEGVYQWYSDMFREHDYMPWVGLARMVGAPVVEGLEQSERGRLASYLSTEFGPLARYYVAVMQVGFLTINRDIFMDLAWHHKAYAEKKIDEIEERWAAKEIDPVAASGWHLVDPSVA